MRKLRERIRSAIKRLWRGPDPHASPQGEGRHIAEVSRNPLYFHGYARIPFGLMFYFLAFKSAATWPENERLEWVLLVVAICSFVFIQIVYVVRFGRGPDAGDWRTLGDMVIWNIKDFPKAVLVSAAFLLWFLLGIFCVYADWSILHGEVSTVGVWLAFSLALWYVLTAKVARHYAAMAIFVFATSILPLSDLLSAYWLYSNPTVFEATLGTIFIVGGILDHRLFKQAQLRPSPPSWEAEE